MLHTLPGSVLFVCFVFREWTVEVRPLRMSTLHVFRWMTKSGATSSVTCLYTFYHHQAVWPGDLRFLIHWLRLECWIFPQWVKTLCYFHPSRSIFIAVVGLGFSCLFGFRVLLSITQYKQQEQICVVISDTLFRQHSIKHPRSYKELPACPLKVTPNLPSGQWSWVTMIAKTGRKRHIELAPYLIFTTQWTCGESMALITALLYRPGSIERIKNWTNTLLNCQKHSSFISLKVVFF